jgi:hypothetical protein
VPAPLCRSCGTAVPFDEPIPRDAECPSCGTDVRCCLNCRHYDPALNNQCRETEADPVPEKSRRNFCEFFSINREAFGPKAGGNPKENEARDKLNQIFGGNPSTTPSQTAREKIEGLFGPSKPADDRAADARKKLDSLFDKPKPE